MILTTTDGLNFTPVGPIPYSGVTDGFARLGIAFGKGDTFWAKSSSTALRQLSFDLTAGTGAVNQVYFTSGADFVGVTAIGFDRDNDMLAGVAFNEPPHNLHIYDTSDATLNPAVLDQEFYVSRNDNGNGTGAASFDSKKGRIFTLDTNNGLLALKYAGRVNIQKLGADQVVTWTATTATLQSSTNVNGTYLNVPAATSPYTNSSGTEYYFRLTR